MSLDKLSITKRLFRGAFWGGVATAGTRSLVLVSSFFLAHVLGKVKFGEYGVIHGTALTVGSLAGMGLGQTITKHIAELRQRDAERCGRILSLTFVVACFSAAIYGIGLYACAPLIATKALAAPHLSTLLQISAISVFFGVINSVQKCLLSGLEAFKDSSYVEIISGICQFALIVSGAWFWNLKGAIAGLAMSMVLTVALTSFAAYQVRSESGLFYKWDGMFSEWRVLVNYSLPTFLILMCMGPINWITNAFLANQPNGYAELGVFNAAFQWQVALQLLAMVLCTAAVPVMSGQFGRGELQESRRVMLGMVRGVALIIIPIAVILCFASPLVMRGYGSDFAGSYWVMVMLVVTGTFTALLTPVANMITASGRMWSGFLLNTGWVIAMLTGGWLLVKWGAEGLALSRLLAAMIHGLATIAFVLWFYRKAKFTA